VIVTRHLKENTTMAKDTKDPTVNTANAPAEDVFNPDLVPKDLTNVAAKLPVYNPGDARMLRAGTLAPPIHGHFLGIVDLPSTQTDAAGNLKPWIGIVVELIQPAPVKEGPADNRTTRMAKKGERVIFTESTAFSRFSRAAEHPTQVFEAYVQPKVSKNKKGQPLWVYEDVRFGRPIVRTQQHIVAAESLMPEMDAPETASAPQLPAHATATA
jgi:hypothetical protein